MLQWMGGARRKMKATKDSKLKRQREFFDHRKEKKRRNELGVESGKLQTLADYIRQNLHGGESLDILGLRSLNPSQVEVNASANSDANLPDPAIAASKPNSGDAGGATVATSNVSASSVGVLKGDDQDTSPQQPECEIKSRKINQEQERDACAQRKPGVADAAQQEIKKLVSRNTELPLSGKGRNPVQVRNLQTKKVTSARRLNSSDMIISDVKGDSRGKKRSPSEVYAVFSQDAIDSMDKSIFDQHPQQTFILSDRSVTDWGDTMQLLPSSLQLNNSSDCHPETQVTETSGLLSRFLSTQKLKSFKGISSHQQERQPQEHNMASKDPLLERESLLNSFRVTHNESHNSGFFNPTFNMTNGQVEEHCGINFSRAMFDMDNFHVKQEPEEFVISDPFVPITSHHVKQEHQDPGLSNPYTITKNHQVNRERKKYDYLNSSFNTGDDQVTQGYPFLPDLSYDRDPLKADRNFFDQKKGSSSPENDPANWDSDPQLNTSSTPSHFKSGLKREFPAIDHFRSVQVPSCDGSPSNCFRQFGTYNDIPEMTDNFYPHLENRETADVKLDKLRLPLDGFEVEGQHTEAAFSSLDDYSPRQMKTNGSNFENGTPDWDDVLRKKCRFSDLWKCEPSEAWDCPRRQENNDPAHSGGNSGQTRNHNDDNSRSQTVAGGTAEYFSDYLTGDINVMHGTSPRHDLMQGKDLSSETQATIAPEILQDSKPRFLPQINNGEEDFIIVCFSDNQDSPNVDANTIHLPIQSINIPLQLFGTVESSSKIEQGINVLSPETPLNRISQEIDDSRVFGKVVTAVKTTTATHNIWGREDSTCDTILTSSHQSRKDYLPLLNSVSSLNDTEGLPWQVREPQREAFSEFQSPKARRSSPNLLALEVGKFEDGLEHHSSNSDKADQCFSSNVLYDHCDDHADHAVQHEMMHNVEENPLEVCTPLEEVLQENMNGMSRTKAKGMLQKRLRAGNAHENGCQASFSSQEECSPAFQLNTVQTVLCKLQRPVCSCSSKQGKFSEHGIKNVDTVLSKLQRPSDHGLGHQDAEGNQALQKNIKLTSDMNQRSDLESEIKPTAECEPRSLTHLNISGSRGSLPLSNADRCCMERPASKPISRSSKEGAEKRGLSDVCKQINMGARLSLDDIDEMASSSHRNSIQPYQRGNGSKDHSLRSEVQIKNLPKSSVPAEDSIQHPTSVLQRNQISVVPEEQPSTRISDPPARDAELLKDCTPFSQRNPILVVRPVKVLSQLTASDPPASHTGALEFPSNTPQVSEREKVIEASQYRHGLNGTQQNLPSTENFQQDGASTTYYDAAYVKMLESYVVQLKLENNILRLSNCS